MQVLSLMWAVCPSVRLSCNTFDSTKYVQRIYWLKSHKGLTKTLTPDHLMCSPWSKGIHLQPPGFLFYHSFPQPAPLYVLAYHAFQTVFNPNSTMIRKPCLIFLIHEPHVWNKQQLSPAIVIMTTNVFLHLAICSSGNWVLDFRMLFNGKIGFSTTLY